MTKLQVELAKAKARITKAVRKHVECGMVTVGYDQWCIQLHVWDTETGDIIASLRAAPTDTTKQVIQQVNKEFGRKS